VRAVGRQASAADAQRALFCLSPVPLLLEKPAERVLGFGGRGLRVCKGVERDRFRRQGPAACARACKGIDFGGGGLPPYSALNVYQPSRQKPGSLFGSWNPATIPLTPDAIPYGSDQSIARVSEKPWNKISRLHQPFESRNLVQRKQDSIARRQHMLPAIVPV
jgi:hypothetical protein